MERTNA